MPSTPRTDEPLPAARAGRGRSCGYLALHAQRWSAAQADKYYRELVEALKALASQPALGRPCDEIRAGYRRHNVGSHVIFLVSADDEVDVVRILHARRDFRRHLPKA